MAQQSFVPKENEVIQFRGSSNLRVTGWERPEVTVDAGFLTKIERSDEGLRIKALDDAEVFVPSAAQLVIERVGGNLRVANLAGVLMVEKVGGNAAFSQVAAVQVGKVGGDCQIKNAAGTFSVEKVGGNIQGADFAAGLIAGYVGGDFHALGVHGKFEGRAGGDVRLSLSDREVGVINTRAGGDVQVWLPVDARFRFELTSDDEKILINVGGQKREIFAEHYSFTQGEGGSVGTLRAGGKVKISDVPENGASDLQDAVSSMEARLSGRIRSRMERIDTAGRANSIAQDALRRAEERIHAAIQRVDGISIPPVVIPPIPPVPPEPPVPPAAVSTSPAVMPAPESAPRDWVNDEERLIILRMLQEKKITVEQAEALMEALDSPDEE